MEEHIDDNAFIPDSERETVLKGIDWKRRQLAGRIVSEVDNPPAED